jgi:hypothetical protein
MLLLALANYADEANSCYPSHTRLATMTGEGMRSIRRYLAEFETDGLIKRSRRNNTAGHRTSDRYVLLLDRESLPAKMAARPDEPNGHPGQNDESLPATEAAPTGQSLAGEPKEEPKEELQDSPRARARASRIPDDWQPTAKDHLWAQGKGYGEAFIARELEKFINYWQAKAGRGATKTDWSKTWHNWLITAEQYTPSTNGKASRLESVQTGPERGDEWWAH